MLEAHFMADLQTGKFIFEAQDFSIIAKQQLLLSRSSWAEESAKNITEVEPSYICVFFSIFSLFQFKYKIMNMMSLVVPFGQVSCRHIVTAFARQCTLNCLLLFTTEKYFYGMSLCFRVPCHQDQEEESHWQLQHQWWKKAARLMEIN